MKSTDLPFDSGSAVDLYCHFDRQSRVPGDQEEMFKLAIQLRTFFYSAIYNTSTGCVLLVYLTDI
jgi:hypothetical protein